MSIWPLSVWFFNHFFMSIRKKFRFTYQFDETSIENVFIFTVWKHRPIYPKSKSLKLLGKNPRSSYMWLWVIIAQKVPILFWWNFLPRGTIRVTKSTKTKYTFFISFLYKNPLWVFLQWDIDQSLATCELLSGIF